MASRLCFVVNKNNKVETKLIEFKWIGGLAFSQRVKCASSILDAENILSWAGFIGFAFGITGVIISAVGKIKKGIKIPGIIISAVGCVLGLIAGFGWIYYYA